MSDFLKRILDLIHNDSVRISEHGYDELTDDNLSVKEILEGIDNAKIVEEYPDYPKGKCILVLQKDRYGSPIHVLWGIPKGYKEPAVLITSYRPDPKRWDNTFMNRID